MLQAYRHDFNNVKEEIEYYFTAGDEETEKRLIRVIHRPVINHVEAVLQYPRYTGKAPDTLSVLAGRVSVLSGTKVFLSGEVSKSVRSARLNFLSGKELALGVDENIFYGELNVLKSDTVSFSVTDSTGLTSEPSVKYPFICRVDRAPSIEIIAPEDQASIPRSFRIPIQLRAVDDYGLSRISLRFMKEGRDRKFAAVDIYDGDKKKKRVIERSYDWSLQRERVFPGDRVLYYLETWDNNSTSGPGYSRSETRSLIAASLSDLYAKARKEEELRDRDLGEIVEESEEIRDRMKELSDEFKSTGKIDWEQKEEGKELLALQEKLREKIRDAAEGLQQSLREFEENRMTSMEIGKNIEEVQKLLEKIENEDLLKAMEKFQEMMRDMPENEIAGAMDEIDMRAEDLSERLDRTIELLNRIMKEEKMEELLRRMEDILEQQIELRDETKEGDLDQLAGKEKSLREDFDSLEKEMDEFAGQEKEPGLEELASDLKQAKIDSLMREAAEQMESARRSEAESTENNAVNEMFSLYTSMGRCQMAMNVSANTEALKIVEKAAWELVEISQASESFSKGINTRSAYSTLERHLDRQAVIRDAVRKVLADLLRAARMRLGISRETFNHLSEALVEIESVLNSMESRRFPDAAKISPNITTHLNMAVIELLKTSSSSGGSGGNTEQNMQTMMEGQSSIDQKLKQMAGGKESTSSMQARSEMSRLAAEQRKMEELLRQITEESSGSDDIIGELGELGTEMNEVAEILEEGKLTGDLVNKEERILSRMLEAQKSLNRRDYKRERVSRTAGMIGSEEEGEKYGRDDSLEIILEKIRRGMQEKGPSEYEELIQAYFRALSQRAREGSLK